MASNKAKRKQTIFTVLLVIVLGISMLGMMNIVAPSPQISQNTSTANPTPSQTAASDQTPTSTTQK